jgi:anti-sigma regulatory factor (Ser/Thr protein kinase)
MSYVEPVFIAMTRAYQNEEQIKIFIENDYFRNMIEYTFQEGKTYSPVEQIINRRGLDKISSHLSSIMLKNFTELNAENKKDLSEYLQYLFIELMNNIADHAHSSVGGYVMTQYYQNNKKVQYVAVDRGIGFLENIKLNFPEINTEEEAIMKALEKGATSTVQKMYQHEKNAGFGLYAMFEILKMTGGKFVIISNDTLVRYENEIFETKILSSPWKGVIVAFEFFEAKINYDMDYFKRNYLWSEIIDDEDEDYF